MLSIYSHMTHRRHLPAAVAARSRFNGLTGSLLQRLQKYRRKKEAPELHRVKITYGGGGGGGGGGGRGG